MAGHIRTLQVCPNCKGKFDASLICPKCQTRPTRYFIDLWWHGRIKIYTGKDGYPLDSFERAERLLSAIRYEIDLGKFNPAEYIRKELKSFEFRNYCRQWIERRRKELERGDISRSYFKDIKLYAERYLIPFFDRKSVREIRDGDFQDFRNWLPVHLKGKTVKNIFGILHKLFEDAAGRGDVLVIPKSPKIPKTKPVIRWIPPEVQEKILSYVREPYKSLFIVMMELGVRPGEARAWK